MIFFVLFLCCLWESKNFSPFVMKNGAFLLEKKVECGWGELVVEKVGAVFGMAMVEGMGDKR